jgi:hypothetical protein
MYFSDEDKQGFCGDDLGLGLGDYKTSDHSNLLGVSRFSDDSNDACLKEVDAWQNHQFRPREPMHLLAYVSIRMSFEQLMVSVSIRQHTSADGSIVSVTSQLLPQHT